MRRRSCGWRGVAGGGVFPDFMLEVWKSPQSPRSDWVFTGVHRDSAERPRGRHKQWWMNKFYIPPESSSSNFTSGTCPGTFNLHMLAFVLLPCK